MSLELERAVQALAGHYWLCTPQSSLSSGVLWVYDYQDGVLAHDSDGFHGAMWPAIEALRDVGWLGSSMSSSAVRFAYNPGATLLRPAPEQPDPDPLAVRREIERIAPCPVHWIADQ